MKVLKWMLLVTVLGFLLLFKTPVKADGIIIIDPPPEPPVDWSPWLTIRYHRVTVQIQDQVATTKVDQVFRNDSPISAEGTYVFPLPPGASIQRFVMWVDGEPVEGEILPADEARAIYEGYVQRQRDPALLEYVGRDTVRARIFPIPPGEERRVQLEYTEVLPLDAEMMTYRYPLNTERFSARPLENVSIVVNVSTPNEVRTLYSPSHQDQLVIHYDGSNQATVSFEQNDVLPNRDFELYVGQSQSTVGAHMLSYRPPGEDGFFLLFLAPSLETSDSHVLPKDIFLILDTSGSMEGEKLTQAKDALRYVLQHLNAEDRFNVVAFSSNVRTYARKLQPASEAPQAIAWIADLEAMGGTNIYLALSEGLRQTSPERTTILIFLTDGLPTEGIVEEEVLLTTLQREAPNSARIFPFGVGYDVNTLLLDQIAAHHKGKPAYVEPEERLDEQVSTFYASIQSPILTDIALTFDHAQVYDVSPHPLPDLFAGTQLIVTGRYVTPGPSAIRLSGQMEGQMQTHTYEGTLTEAGDADFIPRLWAARRIGTLLTQIRLRGEKQEWVDEVVALSQRYGIITPYTSFLIQEEMLTTEGRERAAEELMNQAPRADSGAEAVQDAKSRLGLGGAAAPPQEQDMEASGTDDNAPSEARHLRYVGDKTFICEANQCTDTTYIPDQMTTREVVFGSDTYWDTLASSPSWSLYFSLAQDVVFVASDGHAYHFRLGEANEWPAPPSPTPSHADATTPTARPDKPSPATPTPDQIAAAPTSNPTATPDLAPTGATPTPTPSNICTGALALALVGLVIGLRGERRI